jgi:hypothetical protein
MGLVRSLTCCSWHRCRVPPCVCGRARGVRQASCHGRLRHPPHRRYWCDRVAAREQGRQGGGGRDAAEGWEQGEARKVGLGARGGGGNGGGGAGVSEYVVLTKLMARRVLYVFHVMCTRLGMEIAVRTLQKTPLQNARGTFSFTTATQPASVCLVHVNVPLPLCTI